jgi:membrane-bound lytic murein transglycosylase A
MMHVMKTRLFLCFLLVLSILAGCVLRIGKPIEKPTPPLVLIPTKKVPSLLDDLDHDSLIMAIERSLQYYERNAGNDTYRIGEDLVTGKELRESLLLFREIVNGADSDEVKQKKILNAFDVYRATGLDHEGRVLFTGYFESALEGSMDMTEEYRYPIYRTPDDIVVANLGNFSEKYKNERIIGRLKNRELVPYLTRADIEEEGSLKGRNLELVWIDDPINLFFLHIQGSGKIRLPDGKFIQVSYAQSNGRPYRSIGKYLIDSGKLTTNEISHQSLKKYLSEHPYELSDILNYNESYIFFRIVENGPIGALGLTLTSGRSIATDLVLFPKGALAFIRLRKPVFDKDGNIETWKTFSRFVLNQDTGGVIKGPGRVDLFCGTGSEAEMIAGSLKENGELYFLVKKKHSGAVVPPVSDIDE